MTSNLQRALDARFSDAPAAPTGTEPLAGMQARGSCRTFAARAVREDLVAVLCATAMAAPSKSDLQQRDIIVLKSPGQRRRLADLVSGQAWIATAPVLLVFCANNRRQRLLHQWAGVPFANDHVDAVINAVADAAIALGAFVAGAEALGLGCCPISAVRNEPLAVSELLGLPDHVVPFAGLALGYPANPPQISPRLPLRVTCHADTYNEDGLQSAIAAYDADRASRHPFQIQRQEQAFGRADPYTWSIDKVRQYSRPERAEFGAFLRAKGFSLD